MGPKLPERLVGGTGLGPRALDHNHNHIVADGCEVDCARDRAGATGTRDTAGWRHKTVSIQAVSYHKHGAVWCTLAEVKRRLLSCQSSRHALAQACCQYPHGEREMSARSAAGRARGKPQGDRAVEQTLHSLTVAYRHQAHNIWVVGIVGDSSLELERPRELERL